MVNLTNIAKNFEAQNHLRVNLCKKIKQETFFFFGGRPQYPIWDSKTSSSEINNYWRK